MRQLWCSFFFCSIMCLWDCYICSQVVVFKDVPEKRHEFKHQNRKTFWSLDRLLVTPGRLIILMQWGENHVLWFWINLIRCFSIFLFRTKDLCCQNKCSVKGPEVDICNSEFMHWQRFHKSYNHNKTVIAEPLKRLTLATKFYESCGVFWLLLRVTWSFLLIRGTILSIFHDIDTNQHWEPICVYKGLLKRYLKNLRCL